MSKLPTGYNNLLGGVAEHIKAAQIRAAMSVNAEMITLYWSIGKAILREQGKRGWGVKVIDHLSADLRKQFPHMRGLSARNLKYMRAMANAYPGEETAPGLVAQIPWGHNCVLVDRLDSAETRLWYAQKIVEHGWSRSALSHHISGRLHERESRAITNFDRTLPPPQSDLAQQVIRDPYHLDFLPIGAPAKEREIENALVEHIRRFLLELGAGFAFVGSQFPILVDGEEYRIDLLFYHYRLRCFVVIELKTTAFKPEYAGKINFYLSAIDDIMRHPDDQPSIGIILCRSKGGAAKVRYALERIASPIGVSTHKLGKELEDGLPSVEQLEAELRTIEIEE